MTERQDPPEPIEPPLGWTAEPNRITRTFRFATFPEVLGFMVEIGMHCESVDHHPDWTNSHRRLDVALSTHSAGRVTARDVALARHMESVFARGRDRPVA